MRENEGRNWDYIKDIKQRHFIKMTLMWFKLRRKV